MELIVINENKLKIVMSETDMKHYGFDENEFYCSVTNTKETLARILQNSPVKTGFENISSNDKILIQLYPDINGGCELYVTKITLDQNEEAIFMPENEERYLLPKPIAKKSTFKTLYLSYKFEKLEHSISAAKELLSRDFSGESIFYRSVDGKYFLLINSNDSRGMSSNTDFLSEFGETTNPENTYLLLLEYGQCIFKQNAIGSLAEL